MNNNKLLMILRRLARRNGRLAPLPASETSGQPPTGDCAVVVDGRATEGPAIAAETVRQWLSDGLIERCSEGYRISAAGLSWLRRALSSGDERFQSQHQTRAARIIEFEGARRGAIVNEGESPLRWLAGRKDKKGAPLLAAFQIEAGGRLRADYQFAGLTARVTSSWSPTAQIGGTGGAPSDATALQDHVLAARQRVVRAVAAVGPELSGILVDVCCHLQGLEEAEKTEGWPQRSGKVILQIALTRLARHYGLVSDRQLNERLSRKLQHWGSNNYRPKLGGGEAGS
jgi:hypothetical protein